MKSALPTFLSQFLMSVAVLMFLVGGATFNHPMTGHDHHGHEQGDTLDHHRVDTDQGDIGFAEAQTVHCGANLLALTCEFEPISPAFPSDVEIIETGLVLLKSGAVEPPPPRHLS
ncbi:hypothetical protein [Labrenzia sp. PHM005]|uniref:hypothetical protein n=1 Tax=Labrenzia sp. PHM005 TaxID=2590016 RepID=UPI00113FE189|nr:hypothetical protein [Labrenzia sp. PHM005]QDG78180.1 hypothetical protein FJ695_21225 [Labrenzia sp. PHM005]